MFGILRNVNICCRPNKTMKFIALLYLMVFVKAEHEVSYDNYKLYKILPRTEEHDKFLQNIEDTHENIMVWKYSEYVKDSVDLIVPPDEDEDFLKIIQKYSLPYKIVSEDVENLFEDDERIEYEKPFNWVQYQSWRRISLWFTSLKKKFPKNIKILCLGRTYEGRNTVGVKLFYDKVQKPGVFIEGGMHGCERISAATVTYILHRFLTSKNKKIRSLAEKYNWYFFPVVNPDGHAYRSLHKKISRKTRSRHNSKCLGVDPNRNFGYRWFRYDASNKTCSPRYAGPRAFSEIETRSLARFVKLISHKLFAYISFHSLGNLLTFPYGHSTKPLDNYDELLSIGKKTVAALRKCRGTRYKTGNVASVLRRMTGTSTDWVKAALKMPIVFTYMLPDTKKFGLLPKKIIPTAKEVVQSFLALFNETEKYGYPKPMS